MDDDVFFPAPASYVFATRTSASSATGPRRVTPLGLLLTDDGDVVARCGVHNDVFGDTSTDDDMGDRDVDGTGSNKRPAFLCRLC